jgi:hypothetical protein
MREYEQLKEELERNVARILQSDGDRNRVQRKIIEAYLREREQNEKLRALEREIDRKLTEWSRQVDEQP